jgi:replicative DNA helicase
VDKARGYLLERGLAGVAAGLGFGVVSEEVVRKAGLDSYLSHKFVGRLLIPSRHNGRTVTLTARALLGQEPKYDRPGGEIAAPFNADALNIARKSEWVLLCEGELDAASVLVAWGSDAPVLGLPGGKLPQGWAQKLKGLTCYLLMDNDEAGERHGIRLLEELAAQGIKACRVSWMGESENDINALLKKLGPQVLADWLDERLHEAEVPSDRLYVRGAFLGELEARANRPAPAYASGLATLDKLLDGGFTDGLHILGGIAASGKTLLALQLAIHNAEAGRPVIYVSFEQSKFELWARIAARLTSLPIAAFKKGRYVDEGGQTWPMRGLLGQHHKPQMERLEAMARALRLVEGDAGVSSGEGRWTVPVIRAEAERQAEAFGMAPLVVLDYLQRMPAPSGSDRRELRERVAMVASSLQVELARGLGCPVLAISSVNRASYAAGRTRTEGEDLLGVFKESGEVEYSAYTAMLLYRLSDKEAQQQQMLPNMLSPSFDPYILHLVKHREGRPGRVLVKRLGNRGVFEDRGEAKDWQD